MMREGPIARVNADVGFALQQLERVVSVTADYVVDYGDRFILVDSTAGVVTVTLPLARNGLHYTVLRIAGANNVNVAASGTDTINGAASIAISASWTPVTVKDFSPTLTGYATIG